MQKINLQVEKAGPASQRISIDRYRVLSEPRANSATAAKSKWFQPLSLSGHHVPLLSFKSSPHPHTAAFTLNNGLCSDASI